MAQPMLIVIGTLAGAITLSSWGRPRAGIVAALVALGLALSRVLTPQEAFAGFGDPVVILIAPWTVRAVLQTPEGQARLAEGRMKIVGAIYEIETGRVRFLNITESMAPRARA